jgi:hypothetical protein
VAASSESGNELSGYIKFWEFVSGCKTSGILRRAQLSSMELVS